MIQFTDAAHATFYVQTILMIVIPSALTPGTGKCLVFVPGAQIEVSRHEAERLGELLVNHAALHSLVEVGG